MSSKRELRSGGSTSSQTLDATKVYKLNSSGALVEATTVAGTDIVFTGSKSALRRLNDLERNVSILAAKALTDDGEGSGYTGVIDYAKKAGAWYTARTLSLTGDVTGSATIDGSGNVSLATTVASNTVALGTDTTGNYMVNVTAGTGISVSHTQGEGSTATVSLNATTDNVSEGSTNLYHTTARARGALSGSTGISYNSTTGAISCTITQYTDALARGAVSFTAGSGAYNSTTGVFTIPTNTNQLTNGAGFITGYTETDTLATVTGRGASTSTAVTITNATASSSKITGALIVTGGVGVSGAVYVGGEVTAYASDAALKTNVVAIDNALSKVEAIRGVSYDWNEAGVALGLGRDKQVGVIAQEVEAVLPELVVQSAHEGYKTVKYDKLTALLIEAVKDLSAKVKTLEAQLGSKPEVQ